MKIERIEDINLLYQYPENDRFQYAGGICTNRLTTLILVHTDTNHVGIGSVYSHPSLIHLIIRDQLNPLLIGEDPRNVEELWKKMYGLTLWYGRKGVAMSTLGGVDTALWDLRGKSVEKPVWELLGGERKTCPAYASGLLWKEVEKLAEEAGQYIEKGFRRVKMRLARSEEYDTSAILAVRKAIGMDHDVIVDASMRYHFELACRMGDFLKEQKVFWYEEPFAPEDIDSYTALRQVVRVPIAGGENEFGLQGFREMIRAKALDIVQPDASRCGGISEAWKIAKMAEESGLGVATHSWNDAVAIIANAHMVSAAPNGITVEVDQMNNPFVNELLVEPLQIEDGELQLSHAPGLGIQLDLEVIDKFRMGDPLTIPDGVYSDMTFGKSYFPEPIGYEER
ncbi:TPA: mandelate racemase/muconate lactonizing enzyme family protein [Candidatus Poribacteria bacterium]|nr:mandelate racemase/muconate lactonizing enzyme family protein [Candidatus Poribacteria bacterium]HIA66944.1 mandelate racemase/muconate lactonizing enzyme family protein [Candidatus Poribacteria bacterium]HIB86947.1 mandelate racemase/muconate lactonizing enzyme family protein [Candidatus Poribacteria bacterium]HIB99459.1 mandelate racemase/muconate lactonizing enzyme family protein [Candidatus Poribacteria bacterium]HIC18185.1 mandelate racemase/muconate lactonizing enzyme family protein [C